jgi:hypothetical protein
VNEQPQDQIAEIKAAIAQIMPLTQRVAQLEDISQQINPQTQEEIEQLKQYLVEVIKAVNLLTQRVAKLQETYQGEANNTESSKKTFNPENWQDQIEKNKREIEQRINTAQTDIDKSKRDIEQGMKKLGESLNNLFKP